MASKAVCRACLCNFEQKHRFDGAIDSRLQRQFKEITNIELKKSDGRPTSICLICRSYLQKLHKFAAMVQCSEKVLNYYLGRCLKITPDTVFKLSIKRPDFRVRHLKSISIDNLKIPLPFLAVKKEEVIDKEEQNVDDMLNDESSSANQLINVGSLNSDLENFVTRNCISNDSISNVLTNCYSDINFQDVSIDFGHHTVILDDSTDKDDYQKVIKPDNIYKAIDNRQFGKLATESTDTITIYKYIEPIQENTIKEAMIENGCTITTAITNQKAVLDVSTSIFAIDKNKEQSAVERNKEYTSFESIQEQRKSESMNDDAYSSMCLNLENYIKKEPIKLDEGLSLLRDTFINRTISKLSTREKLLFEEDHLNTVIESSIKKETMDVNNLERKIIGEGNNFNTALESSVKKETIDTNNLKFNDHLTHSVRERIAFEVDVKESITFSDNDIMTPTHPKIKEEPFHFDDQEHCEAVFNDNLYPEDNLTNTRQTPNEVKSNSKQITNLNLSGISDFSMNSDDVQDCLILENNASPIVVEDMDLVSEIPLVVNESKHKPLAGDKINENSDNLSNLDLSSISDGSLNLDYEDDFSDFETFLDMNELTPNQKQNGSSQNSNPKKAYTDETIGSNGLDKSASRTTKAKFGLLFGESSDSENSPIKNTGDRPFRSLRPDFELDYQAADNAAPDTETNCTSVSLFGTQKPILDLGNKPKSQVKSHRRDEKSCAYELFMCEECFQTFKSSNGYRRHIKRVHAHQHCFECTFCDSRFDSPYDMKNHVKDNHARSRFSHHCNKCKKKYQTLKNLLLHKKRIHHEQIKIYTCSRCPKNFVDKLMHKYHILFVHPPVMNDRR